MLVTILGTILLGITSWSLIEQIAMGKDIAVLKVQMSDVSSRIAERE